MAIRSGQAVYQSNGYIISRLQSANTSLNIPVEIIEELGNELSVGLVRDTPDLSFDIESLDASAAFEGLLQGIAPGSLTTNQALNFTSAVPITVLSPFRSSATNFAVIQGAILPALQISKASYKWSVAADASQTFTLKGDSIFYTPIPYEDTFTGDGTTVTWTLAHTAAAYFNNFLGATQHVLNVSVTNSDGTFYRLFNGASFDYTDTTTSLTLNAGVSAPSAGAIIKVAYASTAAETISQAQNTSEGVSVNPAALKSRDVQIYLGTNAATPTFTRLGGIQSWSVDWSAEGLQATRELGNALVVSQDYTVPQVSGSFTSRDSSVSALFAKIYATSGVSAGQVIGALSSNSNPLPVEIHLNHPDTGARLKTVYIPDAVFEPPDINNRVKQLLETPFKFMSNTGVCTIFNGSRPGGVSNP